MWDGRVDTLEQQVLLPIENEMEMGLPIAEALERLRNSSDHKKAFDACFRDGVTKENLGRALAGFVRRLMIGDSPIDRFQAAIGILSREERTGLWIYESKGKCWRCHSGPNFSDEDFHNTGVGVDRADPDPGRMGVTGVEADRGRFKTPTLRGLTFTAPYMHDGSLATLEEVVEFYRKGGGANQNLDSKIKPLDLTDEDAKSLLAFLEALSHSADPDR